MAAVLIIDLDGVVRHWDAAIARRAEQRNGLPAGCLQAEAFAPEHMMPAITGKITDEQWRAGVADALAARYGLSARQAVNEWSQPLGTVDQTVLDLVRQQRRIRRVALFSNATTRLPADLEQLGLHDEFDVVLNSSTLGAAKPDVEAFHAALEVLETGAADCLFVDDTAGNVTAAASLDFSAHRFTSVTRLAGFLSSQSPVSGSWR